MFMTQRLEYIDQLKGLAMLLVVIGHIIVFCGLGYDNIFHSKHHNDEYASFFLLEWIGH